ncbi:MAG: glycosyltransferase [Janthinobacterium lividum]
MWQALVEDAWRRSQAASAAGQPAEALQWLERAHRMVPSDGTVASALAGALLQAGEAARAASLFAPLARDAGMPEAWAGLAACRRRLGDIQGAVDAVTAGLRCSVPTPTLRALAEVIAGDAGLPGWCGLDGDGWLHVGPARPSTVLLDGEPAIPTWTGLRGRLPPSWRGVRLVQAEGFLGSPIPVTAITRVEGFVELADGGLQGWAWHPADPARPVVLTLDGRGLRTCITAPSPAANIRLDHPLARPWAFQVPASALAHTAGLVSVRGADGRHLLGSPLDPGQDGRAAAALASAVRDGGPGMPAWADAPAPARAAGKPAPVDVVIPVYRGLQDTLACLASVLASVPRGTRVVVVDDASPEPELSAALDVLHRRRRIRLIRHAENQGFPATANAGLRACAGRDVVLLNSDTLVPPGWLIRLRAAAYSAPDIGTATPLSNDATILSYPGRDGGNPVPDLPAVIAGDALAQQANGAAIQDLPTGVGFCLYLRRDCLDAVGLLREDVFAQGYGEENDFCLRARHLGWRSVAAPGVFVGHAGSTSFGAARRHLVARNMAVLNRLHPGYDALIQVHEQADPLRPARRRMDELRWAAGRRPASIIAITHAGAGGVERVIQERAASWSATGHRAILLRPAPGGCQVASPGSDYPNLRYDLPDELPLLARLLRPDRVRRVELHHQLGHHPAITGLARLLRAPQDAIIHDYAGFCPRIALVSTNRRYCGEPDLNGCEACIADLGTNLEEDLPVPALVARTAGMLAGADRVITPSNDAATRISRHFPGIQPIVEPWEDDGALPPLDPAPPGPVRRVCVIGAVGLEKGYEVLLGCVRDARRRGLPLHFTVVGYTTDDQRLLDAGPVFITGEYRDADAVPLIRAQGAHLSFLPSVWPETWCFALSRAWQAGLAVVAFDLGAPTERIRATGRGWLLPLGWQSGTVNDALLQVRLPASCAVTPPIAMVPPSVPTSRRAQKRS